MATSNCLVTVILQNILEYKYHFWVNYSFNSTALSLSRHANANLLNSNCKNCKEKFINKGKNCNILTAQMSLDFWILSM